MTNRLPAIARYAVLEAWRTRLPLSAAIVFTLVLAFSFFVRELALIGETRMQAASYAAIARVAAVFIIALHVAASLVRDFSDKGVDAVLALDVARWQYLVGKFAGYALVAAAVAAAAALPLFALVEPDRALAWLASLALESCIIAALTLFCVVTFSHLAPALSFVAGFYLLARAITGLQLLARHPIAGGEAQAHTLAARALEMIALVMPPLDEWTRTAWLTDAPVRLAELAYVAAQSALYVGLMLAAALVDFYRKSL